MVHIHEDGLAWPSTSEAAGQDDDVLVIVGEEGQQSSNHSSVGKDLWEKRPPCDKLLHCPLRKGSLDHL